MCKLDENKVRKGKLSISYILIPSGIQYIKTYIPLRVNNI